jgi:hypothetical protein
MHVDVLLSYDTNDILTRSPSSLNPRLVVVTSLEPRYSLPSVDCIQSACHSYTAVFKSSATLFGHTASLSCCRPYGDEEEVYSLCD